MPLDPKALKAQSDAQRERLAGPLWGEGEAAISLVVDGGEAAIPSLSLARSHRSVTAVPQERKEEGAVMPPPSLVPSDVDALHTHLERIEALIIARSEAGSGEPDEGWIAAALGDPRDFDRPDGGRSTYCVRVRPELYAEVQFLGKRLGLHSTAAALEAVLRLGVAAAGRVPIAIQ